MIRRKQESIAEIQKLENSMKDLKIDIEDPNTKVIYDNLEYQVKELNNKLLNETGFESWELENESKVEKLLKDSIKVKYQLDQINYSIQKR